VKSVLLGTICIVPVLVCLGVPPWASGGPVGPPPSRDFAEYLRTRDLVVEGEVLSVDAVVRRTLGTCGIGLGPFRGYDIRLAVTAVRFGIADDSVIVISTISRPSFPTGLGPGTRVIAWATHECDDGWRLWGSLCVVSPAGAIVGEAGTASQPALQGQQPGSALTHSALDSALAVNTVPHTSTLFEGAANVALLRLVHAAQTGPQSFTYECDSVGWVLGAGSHIPRYLDFVRGPDCYPEIFPGDSLLLPLPQNYSDDRYTLSACPRSLKVKLRFAPALGVPLEFLRYALRADQSGLHVRPFIGKDQ
jgi:hypothetical protein